MKKAILQLCNFSSTPFSDNQKHYPTLTTCCDIAANMQLYSVINRGEFCTSQSITTRLKAVLKHLLKTCTKRSCEIELDNICFDFNPERNNTAN